MTFKIRPYKAGSKSAKALAHALGCKRLKLEGSAYSPVIGHTLINWGNTSPLPWPQNGLRVLNHPSVVRNVSNKKIFFNIMDEKGKKDYVPSFWFNKEDIPNSAFEQGVVCRTVLAGHSGEGIVMAYSPDDLVPAPLYVGYVKKKDEYRIHLGLDFNENDVVTIMQQRKARRLDVPDSEINWKIRNHANGFIYQRNDVNPPSKVVEAARVCFSASGLHFGAVDVVYNSTEDKAYVLEINTAPGLEGSSVTDYATFFKGDNT